MIMIEQDQLPDVAVKFREFEKKALEIRRFAGLVADERLDPFNLASLLKLRVVSLSEIDGLSESVRDHLSAGGGWSGGLTEPMEDGSRVIVINHTHSPGRQAATLMEEICHSLLGHRPSRISGAGRSYDKAIEDEAYGVGAAALVPYQALSEALTRGEPPYMIAKRLGVTHALVEYRMRVLGLWRVTGAT